MNTSSTPTPSTSSSAMPASPAAFEIGGILSQSWELFTKNAGLLLMVLAVVVIPQFLLGLLGGNGAIGVLMSLVALGYMILTSMGMISITLKLVRGQTATIEDLFANTEFIQSFAITFVVVTVMIGVGLFLLIVPGIYLGLRYFFAQFVSVDKRVDYKQALEMSDQMTMGQRTQLLILAVILAVINGVAAIPLGLGLLVTVPMTMLSAALVYEKLSKSTK